MSWPERLDLDPGDDDPPLALPRFHANSLMLPSHHRMMSRLIRAAVLSCTVMVVCACKPPSDPTKPSEKHVIRAAELLRDTSNLESRVERSAAVDFSWNQRARIEWTTARQGMAHVVTGIVVHLPDHSAPEAYDVDLLRVWLPESYRTTARMVVSLRVRRTNRWGEKGAMVTLHTDGHAVVGMYRRWPWSDW